MRATQALALLVVTAAVACRYAADALEHHDELEKGVALVRPYFGSAEPETEVGASAPSADTAAPTPGRPAEASSATTRVSRSPGKLGDLQVWTLFADDVPLPSSQGVGKATVELAESGRYAVRFRSQAAGKSWSGVWVGERGELTRVAATGDRVRDLELMGVTRPTPSELRPTSFEPASIEFVEDVWLLDDGRVGLAATCWSGRSLSSVGAYCLADEGGIVPVALVASERPTPTDVGGTEVQPARSGLDLVRGVDSQAFDGMTGAGEFVLYAKNRSVLLAATAGQKRVLAQAGPAPGLSAKIEIASFAGAAAAASTDAILFCAQLAGPGLKDPYALYVARDSGPELLGRLALGPGCVGPGGRVCIASGSELLAGTPGALAPVRTADGVAVPAGSVEPTIALLADGTLALEVEKGSALAHGLWLGVPEKLTHVAVSAESLGIPGASLQGIYRWKAAAGFLALMPSVSSSVGGSVLFAGPPDALAPILRSGQEIEIAPGDVRVLTALELLDVSARGEVLVEAQLAAEEGVRDASKAVLLVATRPGA